MAQTITVANYLITRLVQAGVEYLFAVPGDYASPFLLAVDASTGLKRIGNINELGSGYAADGYARCRGIGAACVQYGVGTFSLLNCTAGSFVERVPVVIISASPKTGDRVLERQEQMIFHHSTGELRADQIVFKNITVASEILRTACEAPGQIDRAITALLTHKRPIYLEGLNNVWDQFCPAPVGKLIPQPMTSDKGSLDAAVSSAWERIQAAKLPVLWLDVEIQRFGLQDVFQRIVDASGLPFTTTSLGKTVLDERQRQFIGTYAGPASPELTSKVMAACDCPIAIGTIITDDYLDIMKSRFGQMIEVTDTDVRVGHQYYHQVTLIDFIIKLRDRFVSRGGKPREYSLPAVVGKEVRQAAEDEPLGYIRFYDEFAAFYKPEIADRSVLILGESTSLYVFGNLFGLPRDGFIAQAAWGSLGHETGCAIGVALGAGKRPFVIAGDGGFMMICQELSTLARAKCNAVIFVMSNHTYTIEQAFVDIRAFQPEGAFAPFDLLPAWDFLSLAKAFGARGFRVENVAGLRKAFAEISDIKDVPALIEVVIPEKDLPPQLRRLATTP